MREKMREAWGNYTFKGDVNVVNTIENL